MKEHPKYTAITFQVTHEFKETVRKLAEAQHRSMTSYLVWLVMQTEEANRKTGADKS